MAPTFLTHSEPPLCGRYSLRFPHRSVTLAESRSAHGWSCPRVNVKNPTICSIGESTNVTCGQETFVVAQKLGLAPVTSGMAFKLNLSPDEAANVAIQWNSGAVRWGSHARLDVAIIFLHRCGRLLRYIRPAPLALGTVCCCFLPSSSRPRKCSFPRNLHTQRARSFGRETLPAANYTWP